MQTNDFLKEWISCGALFSAGEGKLILGIGKRKWFPEQPHSLACFYFPDFFLNSSTPWFTHHQTIEVQISELHEALSSVKEIEPQKYKWHNSYETFFNTAFTQLQNKIAKGELKKAVPYVTERTESPMTSGQLIKSIKTMLVFIQNTSSYAYGFWDEREGMLGATPEILFRCCGNRVLETMACAGTKHINELPEALLTDPKELEEHDLVVQGIVRSLSPYGRLNIGKLQTIKLKHLMHLVTPLSMKLEREAPFHEIVKAMHPTPALGAFPKEEGNLWLEEYQKVVSRNRFGAPAGCVFPGKIDATCYVAIRNVQWRDGQMQIAAGSGVVADSVCSNEWAEIQLKLETIKKMLSL